VKLVVHSNTRFRTTDYDGVDAYCSVTHVVVVRPGPKGKWLVEFDDINGDEITEWCDDQDAAFMRAATLVEEEAATAREI
jgi:hypothetical protein